MVVAWLIDCSERCAETANDYEANGFVEAAKRVLRHYFNRIRGHNKKLSVSEILEEATYGKNINKGNKVASSFELMYNKKPVIFQNVEIKTPLSTISDHVQDKSRRNIKAILRSNTRTEPEIRLGDYVLFWRDSERWIGPAKVVKIIGPVLYLVHNDRTVTSSYNRVRRTTPPANISQEELEENPYENNELQENEFAEDLAKRELRQQISKNCSQTENESRNPDAYCNANEKTQNEDWKDAESCEAKMNTVSNQDAKQVPKETPRPPWVPAPEERYIQTRRGERIRNQNNASFYTSQLLETIGSLPVSKEEKIESYKKEIENWNTMKAYVKVHINSIPSTANLIGSHVVFRRKMDGTVKARICPWGHRDSFKNQLRTDAPCMSEETFRMLLSVAAEKKWTIAEMDIKAAYLQAKGFSRDVYVRPPLLENASNYVWKLTKAAYGLADSGRLWYLTSDKTIIEKFKAKRSKYEPMIYYQNDDRQNLSFLLVVQVDNYIYTGEESSKHSFEKFLHGEFEISELKHSSFDVFGCEIRQDKDYSITLSQKEKMKDLPSKLLPFSQEDSRSGNDIAAPKEITAFRSAIGKALFIGRCTSPCLLRIASHMSSKTLKLLLHHIKDLEALLRQVKLEKLCPKFLSTDSDQEWCIEVISDAALGKKGENKPREGFIALRRQNDVIHPIFWCSRQIRRVSCSSATAEAIAAANAVDFGIFLKALLSEIYCEHSLHHTTDSNYVFNNVSSTRKPEELRNSIDLAAMRESFENGLLASVSWSPEPYIIADALTKNNCVSMSHLHRVLNSGEHPFHPNRRTQISPKGGVIKSMFGYNASG